MSTLVPTDDLQPGLFVTVHSHIERPWPETSRRVPSFDGSEEELSIPALTPPPPAPDRSCYGIPLRIAAVNLPYVYCMVFEPGGGESGPSILDVRRVRFMRLATETVEVLRSLGSPSGSSAPNGPAPAPPGEGVDQALLGCLAGLMGDDAPCTADPIRSTDPAEVIADDPDDQNKPDASDPTRHHRDEGA